MIPNWQSNHQLVIQHVSVVDASNFTVYQETVDTGSTSEIHVPVDAWTSGNYILKITYGSTTLHGDFVVQ